MGLAFPKSKKELSEAFYRKFPSLDQPCRVRSKVRVSSYNFEIIKPRTVNAQVEDPDVLIKRQQLSQSQSIHELSKIRNLNEVKIHSNNNFLLRIIDGFIVIYFVPDPLPG